MYPEAFHRFALMVGVTFTMAAAAAMPGTVALTLVEVDESPGGIAAIQMVDVDEAEIRAALPLLASEPAGSVRAVRTVRRVQRVAGRSTIEEEVTITRAANADEPPAFAEPLARVEGGLERVFEAALSRPWVVPPRTNEDLRRYHRQVEVEIRREPIETAAATEAEGFRASWF